MPLNNWRRCITRSGNSAMRNGRSAAHWRRVRTMQFCASTCGRRATRERTRRTRGTRRASLAKENPLLIEKREGDLLQMQILMPAKDIEEAGAPRTARRFFFCPQAIRRRRHRIRKGDRCRPIQCVDAQSSRPCLSPKPKTAGSRALLSRGVEAESILSRSPEQHRNSRVRQAALRERARSIRKGAEDSSGIAHRFCSTWARVCSI